MKSFTGIVRILFFLAALLAVQTLSAQKGIIKQANKYYEAGKYNEALDLYEQVEDLENNPNLLYKRGLSHFFTRNADQAITDLTLAKGLGFDDNDIYYYVGQALHSRGSYDDAVSFYKNYLRYLKDDGEKAELIERIKRCQFAKNNQYNDQLAFVENLGSSVNTEFNEEHPVQSPTNQNKYYFSSNRPGSNGGLRNKKGYKDEIYGTYSADMYAVELLDGNWTAVSAFYPILNGPKDDIIQGFNPGGSVLYFLQTQDGKSGEIYADTFAVDKDPEAFPKLLVSPVISTLGDKDMQVFNDNTIVFASKRKGGYGGYDLYFSHRNELGWSKPVNLGPEINTAYDEVSPFLAKSGSSLYFSSDRLESFGGKDIFQSEYQASTRTWSAPINLGIPINSPMDDINFSLSADGMTAVFSSDRIGTMGGTDLFLAYYKDQAMAQLMYTELVPFLPVDVDAATSDSLGQLAQIDEPISSDPLIKPTKQEFYNSPLYYSSDEIIMTPTNKSILDRVKNILTVFPEVSVILSGHSVKEGMREFDLYFSIKRAEKAAAYLVDQGAIDASRVKVRGLGSNYPHTREMSSGSNRLAEKNNRRIDVSFTKTPADRLKVVSEMPTVSDAMLDGSSDAYYNTLKGLSYKIEVARTRQMYKGDVIRQYESGVVEKGMLDNEYLYTIGLYDTYNEAKQMKGQLVRRGIIDAKILPYMNDELLSREQVETLKDVYPDLMEYLRFEE